MTTDQKTKTGVDMSKLRRVDVLISIREAADELIKKKTRYNELKVCLSVGRFHKKMFVRNLHSGGVREFMQSFKDHKDVTRGIYLMLLMHEEELRRLERSIESIKKELSSVQRHLRDCFCQQDEKMLLQMGEEALKSSIPGLEASARKQQKIIDLLKAAWKALPQDYQDRIKLSVAQLVEECEECD
jgi:hypothetical protein